jgi:uncharacterized OB-fold protein
MSETRLQAPSAPSTPVKPVPVPDEASEPFFAGALLGRLMLLRCPECGTFQSPTGYLRAPVRPRCVACFSAGLAWAPASGRATLYTFAIMHQLYDPAFAAELPYNLAVVETEEGARLTSQVVDCANDELRIGMPLVAVFERVSPDVAVPKFRPAR